MKFNYNNTCLNFLEPGAKIDFDIAERNVEWSKYQEYDFKQSVIEAFKDPEGLTHHFKENVRYISETFLRAFNKGKHKLGAIFDKEPINESGTLVFVSGEPGQPRATNTIFYAIKTTGEGKEHWDASIVIIVFQKGAKDALPILTFLLTRQLEYQNMNIFLNKYWDGLGLDEGYWQAFLIGFLCFCKYCEVETKVIEPNRKDHHKGVKYVNETKSKITILDSTWFTTIVSSGAFTVGAEEGGFFRWQPYGPGNKLRKLIWVDAFEKEGYERKAKVLLINENKQP